MHDSFYRTTSFILSLAFLFLSSAGCSELRPEGMPKLHPVTITIIQDGKPLEGASVVLTPVEPANVKWFSGGETDSRGIVTPRVHGKYKGSPAGRYFVSVSKTETEPTPPEKLDTDFVANSYNLIDPKFRESPELQEIEVVSSGKNAWTLDVGPTVRQLVPKR